jgi:hypothetical protein
VKHSRHKGFQVIKDRLTDGRKAPLQTSKRERKHGRDITWTLRAMPAPEWVAENWPGSATVIAVLQGNHDGKAVDETRDDVTSLRTGAEALLRQMRDRWSIENSWHWLPATPSSRSMPTATASPTASRSWPRSGASP